MATTYLNTGTISETLDKSTLEFTVSAVTNIVKGTLIVIHGEAMLVRAVDTTNVRVSVRRGYEGTRTAKHVTGSRFFSGLPSDFKKLRQEAIGLIGDSGYVPDYCLPGARATDSAGNEFIMVDLTATCYSGTTVLISRDGLFTAAQLAIGVPGSVGVTLEQGSSDQYVWAQIYGYNAYAQVGVGSSLCTSTGVCQPASSVATPSVGLMAVTTSLASSVTHGQIYGMYPVGAATTATTSATSSTGLSIPVWLNYPFTMRVISS
jgi:hypothetical protein